MLFMNQRSNLFMNLFIWSHRVPELPVLVPSERGRPTGLRGSSEECYELEPGKRPTVKSKSPDMYEFCIYPGTFFMLSCLRYVAVRRRFS